MEIEKLDYNLKNEMIMHKLQYQKLSNKYNNYICTQEFINYIKNNNIINEMEEELDDEDKKIFLTKNDVDLENILNTFKNSECNMIWYDKNNIDELGNAFDIGIFFYCKENNINFSMNYTFINENEIYYEILYDGKNITKIYNFLNFILSIKEKLEIFDN